ncbi:hypothetical protein GmHk_14G041107 [Glycine max]|nr:hypothetical protein GmHk_14G041107 [Glycine max]
MNPTKLIIICDDDSCARRCRASYILTSKQWEIRKLCEHYTCSNPPISQVHAILTHLLISNNIHNLIENDPSTSVLVLIAHIKSTEGYTTTYRKAWLVKQNAIETSIETGKYRSTIYRDFCKLYNKFFLIWLWRRKHCQCHHKKVKQSCIYEFQYCKSMVQIDETWLYGKYNGTLLVAAAQDDNNKILPIAFVIVENRYEAIKSVYSRRDSGWTTENFFHVFCIRDIAQNYIRAYARTEPTFNHYYNILREEADGHRAINWLNENPGRQWGHMITNLAESINLILKKYCNKYANKINISKRERSHSNTCIDQVYTQVLNKAIEDTQRKAKAHTILEFNRCDIRFLVQETINPRKVHPLEILLKLHMPCSHVVVACKHVLHEYRNYIHPVYTLASVSNVYRGLSGELCNETY